MSSLPSCQKQGQEQSSVVSSLSLQLLNLWQCLCGKIKARILGLHYMWKITYFDSKPCHPPTFFHTNPLNTSERFELCCQILYFNATDLKLGSSFYCLPVLFISVIHKVPSNHVTLSSKRVYCLSVCTRLTQ